MDGQRHTAVRWTQLRGSLRVSLAGGLAHDCGHVMMVTGFERGMPYVIHDSNGGSGLGRDGALVQGRLDGVSMTPFPPLRLGRKRVSVDAITSIQRTHLVHTAQARP